MKSCPPPLFTFYLYLTIMLSNNTVDSRQPESCSLAFFLGSKERFKDLGQLVVGQAQMPAACQRRRPT